MEKKSYKYIRVDMTKKEDKFHGHPETVKNGLVFLGIYVKHPHKTLKMAQFFFSLFYWRFI